MSEIHLRWHTQNRLPSVATQLDRGVRLRRDFVLTRSDRGAEQVDQSVDLVVPVLLLFPRFGRIGRLAVFHRVHAENFDARVDAQDLKQAQRSE